MAPTQATTMTTENAASSTSANTPAVTARILKKRETDRKCQRMIRQRTKSHIAYLEDLVEKFQREDGSGRVETLMTQLSEAQDVVSGQAKKLSMIASIVCDIKLKEEPETQSVLVSKVLTQPEDPEPTSTSTLPLESPRNYSFPSTITLESPPAHSSHDTSPAYQLHNKEYAAYIESSSRASWATSTLQPNSGEPCDCSTNSSALDPSVPFNKWRYANDTLTEWFKWSPQALDMHQYVPFNDDVPVRAVVEGWDAVEKQGYMHPYWRLLKGIDQTIFKPCGPKERLAILQTMGLLLQAHMNPTREQQSKLPEFYHKRPSQDMLHSYATEYFIWPGLRERFVFSEHRYCSNIFWRVLCPNLHLQWPYEFRDCYVRNTETGLYHISSTFQERIRDVRHWTMGMDFFKQYPELYSDIPAHDHIPASLVPMLAIKRGNKHVAPPVASTQPTQTSGKKRNKEGASKKRKSVTNQDDYQCSALLEETSMPAHTLENMALVFSPLSTESYDPAAVTAYDYNHQGIATSLTEMQNLQALTPWGFNGNLDMFQLHPT